LLVFLEGVIVNITPPWIRDSTETQQKLLQIEMK
jgi:hypothetical protein